MNPVTGQTYACFEPTIDYIVTKIPRWPFDKFESANRRLGTQMKATGEVMAIGRTFEESLLKAVRSLESGIFHLELPGSSQIEYTVLQKQIEKATDERLFFIGEAIRQGISIEQIHNWSQIDLYFLYKLEKVIKLEQQLKDARMPQWILDGDKRQKNQVLAIRRLQSYGTLQSRTYMTYMSGGKSMESCLFIKK